MNSTLEIAIPYSAMAISISARFIFIYLLYTKKSVNNLSLAFCLLKQGNYVPFETLLFVAASQPLLTYVLCFAAVPLPTVYKGLPASLMHCISILNYRYAMPE
jgi:hypothetical protein